MLNFLLFAVLGVAHAENENRPLRPTIFPADPALSNGTVDNFQRLYCDPNTIASELKPVTATAGKGHLYIRNEYTAWADISVGEHNIGRLQPLTAGVIHDIPAGTYKVLISVEKMQYVDTNMIETLAEAVIVTPGNTKGVIATEATFLKPGLEDNRIFTTGKLASYQLIAPAPKAEVEAEVEDVVE